MTSAISRPSRSRVVWPLSSSTSRPSPRQREVLAAIADGLTNQQIGQRLGITEDTVKTLTARLLQKLGASNRAHAVAIGYRSGLLAVPSTRRTAPDGSPPARSA